MRRAKTVEEYVALIQDALYEVSEVRAAIEFDEEGMGEAPKYIDDIEDVLNTIYNQMKTGDYCWNTGDLPYIPIIRELDDGVIPFRPLLIRINDTHKNGLEPETPEGQE